MKVDWPTIAISTGVGIVAYALYKRFVSSKIGAPGGLVGVFQDVITGAPIDEDEQPIVQAPGQSAPPSPITYYGPPVLCIFVDPKPGGRARRQSWHDVYPLTVELKNMTTTPLSSPLTFDVKEGDERIVTTTDAKQLAPGERKRFTVPVRTRTWFFGNADCRVSYGALQVGYSFYTIGPE